MIQWLNGRPEVVRDLAKLLVAAFVVGTAYQALASRVDALEVTVAQDTARVRRTDANMLLVCESLQVRCLRGD